MPGPFTRRSFLTTLCSAPVLSAAAPLLGRETAANPVVRENRRPGSPDWFITRPSIDEENHRSREIEGYCSHLSYAAGDELTVYVSTDPAVRYTCELYRMGYYGGAGARKVLTIGPLAGSAQPEPEVGDRELRYCDWAPAFRVTIPEDWLSGVYLGKLSAEGEGPQSYIVFVVRDDRRADLMFQCSDFTWQAYNRWPSWWSLYDYEENQWETRRSNHIGFERPYARYHNELPMSHDNATRVVGSGEFLMWEFHLAYFLEREGYDVTYMSNLDTHQHADLLRRGKAWLSVGHDEYWTRAMYENVAAARDAGVNLLFLSGNSIYGEVDIKPGPTGRPDRVFARNRPFPDEAQLMGASSYGVGFADWTVTDADHWLFQNTGINTGDAIPNLVGWEYHGLPLREDPTLRVVARGQVFRGGGEPIDREFAAMFYDGPAGNFVFNAATCWWSLPLCTPPGTVAPQRRHGDFSAEDPRVQRMTRNLLDRAIAT